MNWKEHIEWISPIILGINNKRELFIIKNSTTPIGQIRIDYNNQNEAEVSVSTLKEFQGKGFTRQALNLVIKKIKKQKIVKRLIAEIHKNNISSIKLFEKLNFKFKEKKVPDYLEKIGKIIIKGLKKTAKDRGLKIKMTGLPALIHFSFDYEKDSQAIQTLFTQEMLKRGFLASSGIYVSYSFKKQDVKRYLKNIDQVFVLLKKAIEKDKVYSLLEGPIAYTGFQRLT